MAAIVASLALVKTWMGVSDTSLDAVLQSIIDGVDKAFERHLNRPLLTAARVEVVPRTDAFQRILSMRAYPITSVASVIFDEARVFTGVTPLATTNYAVLGATGQIALDVDPPEGYGVVQVTYTAGMGADVTTFVAAYPDIHEAALFQVQHEYQRRKTAGASSESAQGSAKTFTGQLELLAVAKQRLAPHRRLRVA